MFIYRTADITDLNKFNQEAIASNPLIQVVLKFGSHNLRFQVSESWGSGDDLQLDNFIASFQDTNPEDKVPKVIDLALEYSKHFHAINYVKGLNKSLIPKRTVTQGEVTCVEWYGGLNASMEPEDLILKVDIVYTRDATGFATSRTTTRTWINRDGTENEDKKITTKYYFINPSDMIDEGLRRRKLLVSSIQIPTLTFMTEALVPLGYTQESVVLRGRAFMDEYENYFNKFVDNSSTITDPADPDFGMKTIIVRIRDEANLDYVEWLDKSPPSLGGSTTIRQYLMNEFDI